MIMSAAKERRPTRRGRLDLGGWRARAGAGGRGVRGGRCSALFGAVGRGGRGVRGRRSRARVVGGDGRGRAQVVGLDGIR